MNNLVKHNIQIFLNSKSAIFKRNNYTSDVFFSIDNINLDKAKLMYISVQTAQIPFTFYNIDDYDNLLVFYNGVTNISYNIPQGNYNVITLAAKIMSLIPGLTITFNELDNTYTFAYTNLNFGFRSTSTIFELLGFTDGFDYISTTGSLTSNISINFFTIRNILIEIDNLILDNISSDNPNNASILCSIPISSSSGSIISYSNIYGISNRVNNVRNFSNLHIRLLDNDLDLLDLNGANWSLTLQIEYYL